MSVPRRFNRPQGLKDIDVLIEDDAPVSIYFNIAEVPEVITQGKSSFLIGGSNLLKPEVEIKFEITNDDSGAVIYTEPVPNYLEGTSRRVSIEVYDDVDLFGDATLTVVGELNPLNTNVPTEFLDTYNVRYTRKIYISSAGVNTQPILFFNQPRIVVNEIVKPYITTTIPTGSVTKTGGATGEPIPEDIGATTNVKEIEEPSKFIKKQKNSLNNKLFGGGGNNAFVNKGRRRARRASPDVDKFTITNKSGDKFDARFIGGEIRIPNPQVDTNKFTLESYHEVPTEYKSDVENVKNQDTLVPEKPFTIIDTRFAEDDPQRNVIVPLAPENLTYTASFQPVPTQSISTVNFRSYADIRLSKLRTFSGDVDRIKIYARNKDAFGDFEVISDQQIESPELLFDVFGAGNQRVGYFLNQAHVNQYWVSSSNAVITQDSTYLLNSVEVSGSNKGYNQFITFEQTGSLPITFNKDTEYNISFNALGFVGEKTNIDNSTENIGRAAIFFSGSGFRVNHDFGDDLGFQLEVNDQPAFLNVTSGQLQRDFGTITEIFSPQTDGNGVFKFVVFGGRFFISDISINPATSTGFSPNFVQIVAPVPPLSQERPDDYEFIAEFYDVNNNVAESIVFASASTFVGGNSYIAGGDNLLSGSMFIGSSIGGGIEMAGVKSGFIRSIGYEGFTSASNPALGSPGFLMFSGSVLPDSGDDYKGVGLELVGGANSFFKFRTDPSVLDIRTDSFFIGQEAIQFMSGSDGNIEISSSLFHLDPKNELLIIGADAVINADLTVNALRTPAVIGGAPSTILNASSSITSQGFARFVSASIGGFHVSDSEISSSGLLLKSTGQMTGSSTLIGNKSAGQFLQFRGSTLTVQGDITANNIRTPSSIGGAPSTDANASSSIDSQGFATFKSASIGGFTISTTEISSSGLVLKSNGQLTGSAVSMSGTITADAGRIAGWRIEGSKLSGSNATLDADGAALFKSDQGPGSDTTAAFDQLRNEYYIDFTPADQGNTQNFFVKFGPNFSVDSSGTLFASGAQFEGTISASKGIIGGFTTDEDSLSSTNIFISGSPLTGGVDDPRYMFISTSNFNVKQDGSISGSQVLFDGGKVGGWNINANQLSANNIKINAAVGYIEAGDLNNVSDIGDSSTGFFVNKDGEILLKAGTTANKNYMQFKDGTLDINTDKAHISGSQITLKSPDFFLGDTNNFISGSGGQLKIQALGTTTISGSAVNIQTPKFFMGGVNQFVSGSNGNIEISSSNFHLQPDGDVIMSGTVTAAAGTIGGFAITDTAISSSNDKLILRGDSGQITGSDVLFTAGKIAAWNISGNNISSEGGGIRLNGNGNNAEISVNSHTFGNAGIQLGFNGGSPRFYVGDGSQNFLKFTTGGGVDIKTLKFELDTDGLEISSTVPSMSLGTGQEIMMRGVSNSPYIALQPGVALVDKNYGEVGIFLGVQTGTTPKFSVVGTGGHLKFDGTGLDINSDTFNLNASTLAISSVSSGSMALGASPPTTFESGSGFFVDGAGNLLLGSTAGDFLQFGASSGNLVIKSQVFSLFTSTIVIDSSVNNGKVALGASPPTSHTSGNGFYADGTGKFLVGNTSGNFIQFNGTQIIIKAPDFFFGDATNFISGSNGNMSIQSGNFELDANNIEISSTQASMSLGEGKIILQGASTSTIKVADKFLISSDGTDEFLAIGTKTSFTHFDQSTAGIIMGMDDTTTKFEVVGNASNYLSFNGTSFDLKSQTFDLNTSNLRVSSSLGGTIAMGSTVPKDLSSDGIMLSGSGDFNLQGDSNNFLRRVGTDLTIKAETFDLDSTTIVMNSAANSGKIALGNTPPTSVAYTANAGFYVDGTGDFLVRADANNFIKVYSNTLQLKTETFDLDAGTLIMDSAGAGGKGVMKLGSSASSITETANTGVYLDGNGKLRVGSATSGDNFIHFDGSSIIIKSPDFFLGDATNFLSGSNGNMSIQSQNFELDANNIELSSTHASMSLGEGKIKLVGGSTSTITVGASNSIKLSDDGTDRFLVIGSKSSFTHFDKSTAGFIVGTDNGTTKFELVGNSSNFLSFDGTNFDIALSQGLELDASNIELSSTHASMSIGNTNPIILQSTGNDRVLRFGNKTDFGQTTTAGFIMGIDNGVPKLDFTVGTGNDNFFRIDSSGVDFSSDNLTINTDRFKITTTAGNERIRFFSGSNADAGRISGAGEFVRIGEISDDASDLYGLKIYDGTGTGSADTLVKLGQDGNQIAGWTITQDRFSGGQMIIRSDGTIESAGFASDVAGSGFRLSAENGGFLEVENAKIRGTMATAVFEKESVNAVGGQLYVANSTTLTGSSFPTTLAAGGRTAGDYPANESTMSVENVTGFVQGEILSLKKVTDTGFSTEYVFVNSASRQNPSSETDFSGQLYVTRGYGSGISGDSGSLGDQPSSAQSYSGSQVIVSTGRYISGDAPNTVGSGYIRMNANPADPATPYIDIIERTGSGIYDVELKARLGDLSGLSSGLLFGETNPGFGLFTENVFLQGAITAVTGSITGKLFVDTSSSQKMIFGIGVDGGSNDGIFINANNYWYTNGAFKVGSATYNLQNDSSGNISINPKTFELDATNIEVSSTHASMSLGEGKIKLVGASTSTITVGETNSIKLSDDGTDRFLVIGSKSSFSDFNQSTAGVIFGTDNGTTKFEVVGNSSNYISFNGSAFDIKSQTFDLNASTLTISSNSTGSIALGASPPTTFQSGTGFFVDGAGNFLLGSTSGNFLQFAAGSGNLTIKSQVFSLFTSTAVIDSSVNNGKIALGATPPTAFNSGTGIYADGTGKFLAGAHDGNRIQFDGTNIDIIADTFFIGTTNTQFISGSDSNIEISSSLFHLDPKNSTLVIGADAVINADLTANTIRTPATIAGSQSTNQNASSSIDSQGFAAFRSASIGGWDIDPTTIASTDDKVIIDSSNKRISINNTSFGSTGIQLDLSTGTPRFFAGSTTKFIKYDGSDIDIKTEKAFISGSQITLKSPDFFLGDSSNFLSGSGGNMSISSDNFELSASNIDISSTHASMSVGTTSDGGHAIKLDGASGKILVGSQSNKRIEILGNHAKAYIATGKSSVSDTTEGFWLANNNANPEFNVGTATNFIKLASEVLDIKVQKANISGSEITLKSPDFFLGDVTNFISGSGGNLSIQSSGNTTLSGSSVNILTPNFLFGSPTSNISGSSTGLAITTNNFSLTGTNLELSNSKFNMGTLSSATDIADSSTGFHVDSSGNVLIKQGGANSEYLKFEGGGLDIKAGTFDLATNKLIIDSGTNNGKIALGSTPPTAHDSGTGFYVDGNGNVLIGAHNGNRVQFDGTNIDIIAETFFIGTTSTQFISGSDSNIEISSSLFHLDPKNNALIIGADAVINADLTANSIRTPATIGGSASTVLNASSSISSDGFAVFKSASIGGFHVTDTQINSTNNNIVLQSNGSTTISGSSVNIQTPKFFMGGQSQFISGSVGNIEISSSNFHLQPDGDVVMSGNVSATTGEIGGFTIGETKLENIHDLGSNAYVSMSLQNGGIASITMERGDSDTPDQYSRIKHIVNSTSAQFGIESRESTGPTVQATQAMIATDSSTRLIMKAQSGSIDNNLEIKNDPKGEGTLIFTGANGQGFGNYRAITRASGNTGFLLQVSQSAPATSAVHFFVGRDSISSGTAGFIHYNGDAGTLEMRSPNFFFGATGNSISGSNGNMAIESNNFELDASNIELSSTQASMSLGEGKIKMIGGSTSTISIGTSNGLTLSDDGTDRFLVMGTKTSFTHFDQSTSGIIIGTDNNTPKLEIARDGDNYLSFNGTTFDIKLSQGFELDASNLELSSTEASMSLGEGKIILQGASTSTIQLGAKFKLASDGTDEFLVIGNKTSFTHFDQSTAGVIMGIDDTTAKFEVAGDANNYLSFTGTSLDIKAQTFDLATTKLIVDSGTNNGKIALGSTPPTSATSGTGVYMDGNSTFLVGKSVGERISFDGSNLVMSASTFLMGSSGSAPHAGAFISGSNANLEISSSNFHLKPDGNVVMSGQVTATSGEIGGFLISQNEISSSATFKRGLVLKPGDSIRGFGSTVHSTRSNGGKFSFGAGQAIAPAEGAGQETFDPSQAPAPGGASPL